MYKLEIVPNYTKVVTGTTSCEYWKNSIFDITGFDPGLYKVNYIFKNFCQNLNDISSILFDTLFHFQYFNIQDYNQTTSQVTTSLLLGIHELKYSFNDILTQTERTIHSNEMQNVLYIPENKFSMLSIYSFFDYFYETGSVILESLRVELYFDKIK